MKNYSDVYVEPQPMRYRIESDEEYEVLFQAQHEKGYKVLIINYFTHPCAYIGLQESHPYYGKDYSDLESVECHGGLTFSGDSHSRVKELCDNGWFLGWDYGHFNDFVAYAPLSGFARKKFFYWCDTCGYDRPENKQWTTEEIKAECERVIEQLDWVFKKAYEL